MNYRWWILIAVALFCIGFGGGLLLEQVTLADTTGLFAEDVIAIGQLADLLESLPRWSIFVFIFVKNVMAIVTSFVLSPFFCLVPFLALILNGGILGWVSASVLRQESLGYLLAGLLPHGIFELPALIMGEAVAFSFGTMVMLALFKKERRDSLLPGFKQHLRYLVIAIILLLPAAIIETYVTPLFLN